MAQQLGLGSVGQSSCCDFQLIYPVTVRSDEGSLVLDGLTHLSGIWQAVNMGECFSHVSNGWLCQLK